MSLSYTQVQISLLHWHIHQYAVSHTRSESFGVAPPLYRDEIAARGLDMPFFNNPLIGTPLNQRTPPRQVTGRITRGGIYSKLADRSQQLSNNFEQLSQNVPKSRTAHRALLPSVARALSAKGE